MANYTLTTSAQEVGRNTNPTVGARMLAWYTNATASGATVHLKLQAISQGTTYTGTNKDYELSLDSTATGTVAWSYSPLPADTWVDVREITQYVDYGRTVNIVGKVWTYVYGDAWITGNTVTLATPYVAPTTPTISSSALTSNSVAITYGTTSFGNPSTGTVTLYGGTTTNPTTVLDTYNATGDHTFTHTGLTPGTAYYYRARANNGQLNSNYSTEISVTTSPQYGLYGSVNDQSKKVVKLYGPVETAVVTGVTGTVRAGSPGIDAGIAFDGEVFYNYVKNTIDSAKTPDYLLMHVGRFGETYTLTLYYTDGTSYAFENGSSQIDPSLYGITWTATPAYAGDDYIDLTATTALVSLSKEIKKLYGSVNGLTKRIF